MEFEGQYLTYEEYRALGGTLDLMPFNLLEFEVRRKIDIRTQERLVNCDEIPQEVKLCENEMINSLIGYIKTKENSSSSGGIKSENTDGYSVTYMTSAEITTLIQSQSKELDNIMYSYLTDVIVNEEKIMFSGVQC